jgi:hypothetical protein
MEIEQPNGMKALFLQGYYSIARMHLRLSKKSTRNFPRAFQGYITIPSKRFSIVE